MSEGLAGICAACVPHIAFEPEPMRGTRIGDALTTTHCIRAQASGGPSHMTPYPHPPNRSTPDGGLLKPLPPPGRFFPHQARRNTTTPTPLSYTQKHSYNNHTQMV